MRSQITHISTCNSRQKSIILETASSYPCFATSNMRWGILKGQHPNRHEPKTLFVMIKHDNNIDGYTIRMRRSVLSLHPIVQKYTILNRNFADTSCLTVFSDCKNCYNNISHYKYFLQNLIVLIES